MFTPRKKWPGRNAKRKLIYQVICPVNVKYRSPRQFVTAERILRVNNEAVARNTAKKAVTEGGQR